MKFAEYSFFHKLSEQEREVFCGAVQQRSFSAGKDVYRGDCAGLIFIEAGRLCAYTLSAEGREITLYRLLEGEYICTRRNGCESTASPRRHMQAADAEFFRVCCIRQCADGEPIFEHHARAG